MFATFVQHGPRSFSQSSEARKRKDNVERGRLKSVNGMIFYVESPIGLTKKLKYMGRENISKTSLPSQTSVNAIPTEIPANGLVSNRNNAHNFHHISQRSADLTNCPIKLVNKMVWNWSRHDQWDGENRRSPSSSHVTDSKGRKACGHTYMKDAPC